jgi:hypothetical protein
MSKQYGQIEAARPNLAGRAWCRCRRGGRGRHVDEAVALYVRLVPAGIDAGGLTASGAVALERAAAVPDGALGAADDGLLNLTINCRVHMQTKDVQCRLN